MFSYPANTNRQAVENLLDTRTASIKQLIDLARHEDTGFDDYQKHWLIDDKLTYAIKNDVSVSPNSLIPIKRTNASAAIHMEIFETAPAGISQVLWEFDTVLNQIMMYMHCWAIPEDNAFYTALRLMVQAQYDARTAV
jgi:hypothetical protein